MRIFSGFKFKIRCLLNGIGLLSASTLIYSGSTYAVPTFAKFAVFSTLVVNSLNETPYALGNHHNLRTQRVNASNNSANHRFLEESLILPEAVTNSEGNGNNAFPFFFQMRYQQLFEGSKFGGSLVEISKISYRWDSSTFANIDITGDDIEIYLSTSSKSPDQLSSTFNDNSGPDMTLVYQGPYTIPGNDSLIVPRPFTFDIVFQNSFIFDPTQGDLLLEIKNRGETSGVSALDSHNVFFDESSRVFSSIGNPDADTGIANTFALVTKFTYKTLDPRAPSMSPSYISSASPSSKPSKAPSLRPSSTPSVAPSAQPSTSPSEAPSMSPSEKPSTSPSSKPSNAPSLRPTTKSNKSSKSSKSSKSNKSSKSTNAPSLAPSLA